ncbi:MAG: PAS domain-containing protein [Gemmatimonas sp.]|nr:PAS domain-containing protein [Gemmatimonas sp.]
MTELDTIPGDAPADLRRLRFDFGDLLDTIGTCVLIVDSDGRLAYLNPAASDLLDLRSADWLDRPILRELNRATPGLGCVIERTARTGLPIRRFETAPAEESGFVLGVSTALLKPREGALTPSVAAIFQDITEKVRAEGLRRRAERLEAVAELGASLAHEIKNPLTSIRSAVEQIVGVRAEPEDTRLLGALIVRESDRLSRLLGEFIDFGRVRVIDPRPVDFRAVVSEVVNLVRAHPDTRRDGVELAFDVPPRDVYVRGAEEVLHRGVFNLVLNAAQWAGRNGSVNVSLEDLKSDLLSPAFGAFQLIRLSVRDTGPGVQDDIRDRIFDPFFTRRSGGTGLGLALVQRAVEAHGGAIFVDNVRPSECTGAVFSVYLPTLPHAVSVRQPISTAVRDGGP